MYSFARTGMAAARTPRLVCMPQWRPDFPADVPSDPGRLWALAGVGRKP